MRVGVDATGWADRRGHGRFTRNAVRHLVGLDADSTYVLFVDGRAPAGGELPPTAVLHPVALMRGSVAATNGAGRPVRDLVRLIRAVRSEELDAFVFPSVYTYFPVLRVPTLVGIHDAIADELPKLTLPNRRSRVMWRVKEGLAVRRATRLFTVSETSRAVLARRLGVAPAELAVVPEAPEPVFAERGAGEVRNELERYGIGPEPYFLFAGGLSPHKNVELLLEAYAQLCERRRDAPALVLVGDLDTEAYLSAAQSVRRKAASLRLERRLRFPGFVPDPALACLYSGATGVVLPSLMEGFGLPAVEAAACGAPLILSDLPAYRETIGDAALYFPPNDREALVDLLERLWEDGELRRSLGECARRAVSGLSWTETGRSLRDLVKELA